MRGLFPAFRQTQRKVRNIPLASAVSYLIQKISATEAHFGGSLPEAPTVRTQIVPATGGLTNSSRWPFLGLREPDARALVSSQLQISGGSSARLQSSSLQREFAPIPQALQQDFELKKCSVNVLRGSSKPRPGLNICLLENIPQMVCNLFANQGQGLH